MMEMALEAKQVANAASTPQRTPQHAEPGGALGRSAGCSAFSVKFAAVV